jgi:radical SAM superfamily enzyme YgiQ (UPF0313 family)
MINFLWINAINSFSEVETRYPNLGIGYLVASLKFTFGDTRFNFRVVNSNIEKELDDFSPHLVGISSVSQNFGLAQDYAQKAHERGLPVIMGGVHISFLPHTLSKAMDVGCVGEGEDTIVDLMQIFLARQSFPPADLAGIQGIVYRDTDGVLHQTLARKGRVDLDSLPMPDRDILPITSHTYMFTSRGCPYRCQFCASSRFWNEVRFFSAERVVTEIELLINCYQVKFISFFDDLFVVDKQRFERIVELLEHKKIAGTVKFSCSVRANTVTESVVQGLKRMGVVSVGMGLESGNQRVLSWLKGAGITVEQNYAAVKLLNRYGIIPNASFVIGSPDETRDEMLDTLAFIKKSGVGLFDAYNLTPFPGTPVWEIALRKGVVSEDENMQWEKLNVNFEVNKQTAIVLSEVLSRKELIAVYDKFRRYRLWHNFKNIWRHPMLSDLPKYLLKTVRERMMSLLNLNSGKS